MGLGGGGKRRKEEVWGEEEEDRVPISFWGLLNSSTSGNTRVPRAITALGVEWPNAFGNFRSWLGCFRRSGCSWQKFGEVMASPSRRLQTKPVITCLKSVLLIYSFIFWITGVILLTVGVWGKVGLDVYFSLLNEKAMNVPYVLIGTGAVIILLGTFGCFATCRANTWMLKLYAMFLSIIFLVELVAAIVGLVFRHEIKDSFEHGYMQALQQYNSTGDARSQAVDTVQKTLQCCGVKSYTDWGQSRYFQTSGIPESCCAKPKNCTRDALKDMVKAKNVVFSDGCISKVTSLMESRMGIVAGISFGIACFQLVGMFLSCCLSRYITNNQYEMV